MTYLKRLWITNRCQMFFWTGVFCLISWMLPAVTCAATLDSLATGADAIVMAVPVQQTSYWEGRIIKTRARLRVVKVLSGQISGQEISIVYDGGVVGKIGLWVSHGVRLPKGQKGVLFLLNRGENYAVLDGISGVFFVYPGHSGEEVVPAAQVVHEPGVLVKGLKQKPLSAQGIPLQDFIARIHAIRGDRP